MVSEVFGPTEVARVLDRVVIDEGCWNWEGAKSLEYGMVWWRGTTTSAHRVVWMILNNRLLDREEFVCHHCDNPPCVRPDHMFIGSIGDNTRDAARKGRMKGNGEIMPHRKLSFEAAREIRRQYGPVQPNGLGRSHKQVSMRQLAAQYGCSIDVIWAVLHNRAWREVVPDEFEDLDGK